ncbi:MAG: type I methionyl aminopeptidase [Acholeplasmataceae bacterium]|nr:type I methionyl aminopeptidase [Acholeplasmataceae bacterium]
MIHIKSEREISLMRQAGRILESTRQMLETHIRPGISTGELDRLAEAHIIAQDGIPSFKGYHGFPGSICASVNETVVHGIPSDARILKEGDIVTLDFGVNYKGYHADSATTYPVGTISDALQALLDVTKQALEVGLQMVQPGRHVSDISHAIESYVKPYGYGIVEDFTGHGIGRDLHEEPYVPNFGPPGQGPILKPGMTFCVEPMVNMGTKHVKVLKDNWTTVTTDRKPSAHFEHMIVVTEHGYEILTAFEKE